MYECGRGKVFGGVARRVGWWTERQKFCRTASPSVTGGSCVLRGLKCGGTEGDRMRMRRRGWDDDDGGDDDEDHEEDGMRVL